MKKNIDEYPTEGQLAKIEQWDVLKFGMVELIEYVKDIWKYADCGYFKFTGVRVFYLKLHTAGWSGNESIISALRNNDMFWMIAWQKSERGGHYSFKWKKLEAR